MEVINIEHIRNKLNIEYLLFLFLVPFILTIICISVKFIPHLKDILVLQPLNPSLFSILFSSYTHLTFGHLFSNLENYIVIIFLILILKTDKNYFFINMVLIFFILPLLISIYIIYYEPSSFPGSGFSGILSGLTGYLSYTVYCYIKKEWAIPLTVNFLYLIIGFNILNIFIIYGLVFNLIWYFSILLLFLLMTVYIMRTNLKKLIIRINNLRIEFMKGQIKFQNYVVFVFTFLFVFGASLVLFPSNIITQDGKVNISVHLIGYIFGIFAPLVVENLINRNLGTHHE